MRPAVPFHPFSEPPDLERLRGAGGGTGWVERHPFAMDRVPDYWPRGARTASVTGEGLATRLHDLAARLGMPLCAVDARTGHVLVTTDPLVPPYLPAEFQQAFRGYRRNRSESILFEEGTGLTLFAVPLDDESCGSLLACGYTTSQEGRGDVWLDRVLEGLRQDETQRRELRLRIPHCDARILQALLKSVRATHTPAQVATVTEEDFDALLAHAEGNSEEIHLLHCLMENMQVSRTHRELAEAAIGRLVSAMPAEQHVIWLFDADDKGGFLSVGSVLDPSSIARLLERFGEQARARPLIRNNIEGTLLGADFPGLREFCLAPVAEGERAFGWLLSLNVVPRESREFTLVHSRLLSSVARVLAVHGVNVDLYRGHDELLLSFVRSLVSSLDAKDPYTRGHSERVAIISRRIGEQLGLPPEDLRDIYLAGLLHDIGKIGVDDEILRKPGSLTADEFEQIKKHPVIGFNILAGLRNLRTVLPGVRSHHEAWNGKGYPDRLAGESIPLMARILAVADSYDAMGSDRPYRKGMPLDQVEQVLRTGAGVQWDPTVVAMYFECRDDIARLCRDYTPANSAVLPHSVSEHDLLSLPGDLSTEGLRCVLANFTGAARAG